MQSSLARRAEQFIREQSLLEQGERVLIGLSGGADSVCLLTVLRELQAVFSLTLGAFHVNHGIRGKEAAADEAFAEALCRESGIAFTAVHEDVPQYAKKHGMGLEEAGRELRYAAAKRLAEECGYDKIALAHQQNDVAETFLFHLFRGSSVTGLSSIPARRGNIIRPLLFCSREEIEAYLKERGLPYCTDSTNAEDEYTRNRIRHQILSVAEEQINQGAVRHVAAAAQELSELDGYLSEQAEELCGKAEEVTGGVRLSIAELNAKPQIIQRRVLYTLLIRTAGSARNITRGHVELVRELCTMQSGKQMSLPYELTAEREFGYLVIRKKKNGGEKAETAGQEEIFAEVPGDYYLGTEGKRISLRTLSYQKNMEIPKNEYTKWFDYDKIKGALQLRPRRAGDRLGMLAGSKSVKALFAERKLTKEERGNCLLLADEAQVLLVPWVRSCDNYRVEETTKTVLEVRLYGGRTNEG